MEEKVKNEGYEEMKIIGATIGLLIAIILPHLIGSYFIYVITMIFFYGYLGLAWNLLGGYSGQFSFGHAAFFGIGAYTSTLLQIHHGINPWVGMLLSGIVGLCLGLFIGYLCFRYGLRGPYFALAMLAFAEMLRLLAVEWMTLRYPLGISIPLKGDSLIDFQFKSKIPYYYICLFMMVVALVISRFIEKRKIGTYFKAIRENEDAANALGVNVFKYKLLAMAVSAFLTSIGGTFYAQYYLIVEEESVFGAGISIAILLGPIIGGVGTVMGPILGGAILEFLSEITRNLLGAYSGVHLMIYGIILIFVIIFLPNGILGGIQTFYRIISKGR